MTWRGKMPDSGDTILFMGDMQRLELRPHDILVLCHPGYLSTEATERLKQTVEDQFPGHKAIVLTDGWRLGVLSPTDENAAA